MRWVGLLFAIALFACKGSDPSNLPETRSDSSPAAAAVGSEAATTSPLSEMPIVPPAIPEGASPKQLYEIHCSACHSLELVDAQHLDRSNWEWVMDDMVTVYGATWLTEEEQEIIIDYLIEHEAGGSDAVSPG